MSSVSRILSLLSAASMMVSGALDTVAPQHDADGLLFLVNRQYTVSEAYEPADLEMSDVPGQVRRLRPAAAEALREMFQACKEETGKQLLSISGYRSYAKQSGIYNRKLRSVKKNVEKAQEYVAPPGASEHQTGMAMDVGQKHKVNLEVSFGETGRKESRMKREISLFFMARPSSARIFMASREVITSSLPSPAIWLYTPRSSACSRVDLP